MNHPKAKATPLDFLCQKQVPPEQIREGVIKTIIRRHVPNTPPPARKHFKTEKVDVFNNQIFFRLSLKDPGPGG